VGVGVRQGAESVVVFLTSSIPKSQFASATVDFDFGDVVLKDGGYINFRESAFGEDNEQAGLAASTVADNDELSAKSWFGGHG